MADEERRRAAATDQAEEQYTDAEREVARQAANKPTALYCDAFYLHSWPGHVRMAFGEYLDAPVYRTAIVMPLVEVKALIKSLTDVVARLEREEPEEQVERERQPNPKP